MSCVAELKSFVEVENSWHAGGSNEAQYGADGKEAEGNGGADENRNVWRHSIRERQWCCLEDDQDRALVPLTHASLRTNAKKEARRGSVRLRVSRLVGVKDFTLISEALISDLAVAASWRTDKGIAHAANENVDRWMVTHLDW